MVREYNKNVKRISYDKNGNPIIDFYDDNAIAKEVEKNAGMMPVRYGRSSEMPLKSVAPAKKPADSSAGLSRLLAQVGMAIAGNRPDSWQYQLGRVAEQTAAGRQLAALRRGEELSGVAGFGITPEERQRVAAEKMAERQAKLIEEELGLKKELGREDLRLREELGREKLRLEEKFGMTPEERRAMEESVAAIRAAAASGTPIKLGSIVVGDQTIPVMYDGAGNLVQIPGAGGPRWKPKEDVIPKIPEMVRQNMMTAIAGRLKALVKEKGGFPWIFNAKGGIEEDDLNRMLDEGDEALRATPTIRRLAEAYDVLRNRLDITAQATDADPRIRRRVIEALSNLFGTGTTTEAEASLEGF